MLHGCKDKFYSFSHKKNIATINATFIDGKIVNSELDDEYERTVNKQLNQFNALSTLLSLAARNHFEGVHNKRHWEGLYCQRQLDKYRQ